MSFYLGSASRENLSRVHPHLVRVVQNAIQRTSQDFAVASGARTAEEQYAIWSRHDGSTQKDGYKNKSNHQITADGYGHAVDLVPWIGRLVWDWDRIYPIALAMAQAARDERVRIVWGGNWYEVLNDYAVDLPSVKEAVERYKVRHPGPDFIDGPHYQLAT